MLHLLKLTKYLIDLSMLTEMECIQGDILHYVITVNNDGYQELIAIAPDDALTDQEAGHSH